MFKGNGVVVSVKNNNITLTLKVKEALPKDVGRAIVRIDPEDMKLIGLEVGDIIEIEGKRKTPAKAMPCYAENRGERLFRWMEYPGKMHRLDWMKRCRFARLTVSLLIKLPFYL